MIVDWGSSNRSAIFAPIVVWTAGLGGGAITNTSVYVLGGSGLGGVGASTNGTGLSDYFSGLSEAGGLSGRSG